MPQKAARLSSLPSYVFAIIGDQIRSMQQQGIEVLRLDVGSPDLPPADFVVEALAKSAADPRNHGYAGYRGTPEFRQAVARYYQRRFGVTVDPDTQVLPLIGSKEGLVNLMLAYLDHGDVALVPEIGYPSYAMGTRLAGAEVCWVPMPSSSGFLLDLNGLPADQLARAKLLWVNYPNNPTGAAASPEFYQRLVEFCRSRDILLLSDNPYVDVTYDGYRASSVLSVPGAVDTAVEFISFSKTYNMAGWRLGAAVGSATAIATLLHIKSNIDSGHFRAIYDAGIAALDNTPQAWIDERNAIYQRRLDLLLPELPSIGLEAARPAGALYIWARALEMSGEEYVRQALERAHVSIAPGAAYGPGGDDYVRISISVPDDRIRLALEHLRNWYSKR